MTDEEVLAELRGDEAEWFHPALSRNAPHGNCNHRQREWLRRLAAARREARELRAELARLTELRQRGCDCNDADACRFARERDEARAELAALRAERRIDGQEGEQ